MHNATAGNLTNKALPKTDAICLILCLFKTHFNQVSGKRVDRTHATDTQEEAARGFNANLYMNHLGDGGEIYSASLVVLPSHSPMTSGPLVSSLFR